MSRDREGSSDRGMVLKHQHSFSESVSSRSSIPMWDSSDPDRAPPPLPLNPGVSSPVTRPNTSATVAAAAEAIASRVRESQYIANPSPEKSPEKALIKGHQHKRMQSMQGNSSVKDLSNYLENSRPPNRSPERARTPLDFEKRLAERSPTRSGTPTPVSKDLSKDAPTLRPSSRPPLKAILGEASPQSATMRALQATPTPSEEREASLSNNAIVSNALVRTPPSFDAISSQILSLTTIATNLQREMAQLSRRSKDNATDLNTLKDATNTRDEDIRKSLRDLVSQLASEPLELKTDRTKSLPFSRSAGSLYLEDKANTSSHMPKSVSLPRIPSPASFAASLDRDLVTTTPNPYSVDGGAAIALLEKILREMSTKEGQERLAISVAELAQQSRDKGTPNISKQLEEITKLLKGSPDSQALVKAGVPNILSSKPAPITYDFSSHPAVALARAGRSVSGAAGAPSADPSINGARASEVINEELIKLLKRMKDSITEGGGMSAEIKALVRELRGEVLGMGREIGRKLEQAESTSKSKAKPDAQGPGREEVARIVEEGLSQLKEHMDLVMREHRRQSSSSMVSRNAVDTQEVYAVVQKALGEASLPQSSPGSGIERDEILEAVRDAWETYKPEIELQNFGLERDEILECLKEGLQEYKSQNAVREVHGASFDEVLDAVKLGLRDFKPPMPVETEASITREEIIMTVRECLESFDFPLHASSREREPEITREDLMDAVKEGFLTHAPLAKELEFNRQDLFDAVKAGLEGCPTPMNGVGDQILEKMQDLIDDMRGEFQQYSAANGRDTEQVLDAMKDGLEVLRANIETYVDRASDVTGKDEIVETVKVGLENLRIDLEGTIGTSRNSSGPTSSAELLDVMEKEFEHLRSTITVSVSRGEVPAAGKEELLDAIREGFDELKDSSRSVTGGPATTDSIQEELKHLRETLATTITKSGGSIDREEIQAAIREGIDQMQLEKQNSGRPESILSNTSELLDAFHEGLDGLKADVERVVNKEGLEGIKADLERVLADINKPIDMTVNYEILDMLKDGLAGVRADLDRLTAQQQGQVTDVSTAGREVVVADENTPKSISQPDIENLEVMITQLKIKVEALDHQPPATHSQTSEDTALKSDVARLEEMLKELQTAMSIIAGRDRHAPEDAATREDVNAIETILMNTKAKIDEMSFPDAESFAKSEQLDSLQAALETAKDGIDSLALRYEDTAATKEDIGLIEAIVKELQAGFEDIRERLGDDSLKRPDIEALEALCVDTQSQVRELVPEGDSVASKSKLHELKTLMKEFHERNEAFQEKVTMDAEMTAQAFEARKIEHGGIADKIEEVKGFLEDVRVELKSKLEGSGHGLENLALTLTALGEAMTAANASESIKDMRETFNNKFDQLQGHHDNIKLDLESHRNTMVDKHDEHRAAVIDEVTAKIDARFDEMMIKYDDAQLASNTKAAAFELKSTETAETMTSTKAIAEDLKLLVDTLGSTVAESCNNISEDSKTVFTKVEDLTSKIDSGFTALSADNKEDHQLTRTELSKTAVLVETLQANIGEHNPKMLAAIGDVFNIVNRHFEEAQKSTEELKTSVKDIPNALPALPPPLASPIEERVLQLPEKYDDSEIHDKLDKLFELTAEAGKSAAQFEMLEQIKNQVSATAANVDTFVKSQLALTADAHESKAREAEETAIALEKRQAQKNAVEGDLVRLSEDKNKFENSVESLTKSVEELKQEEKEMLNIRAKLQAELSSLQTALEIRKEEMHIMEARAERLEKRIVEGVLDHSRSLLFTSKPASSLDAMNLKRVPSAASSTATARDIRPTKPRDSSPTKAPPSAASSTMSSAIGKALTKKRQAPSTTSSSISNVKGNRRILSLSTISGNKPASTRSMGLAEPSAVAKNGYAAGAGALKRSHSVKSNFPSRKSSWSGPVKQIGLYSDSNSEVDKENSILEEDEGEHGSGSGSEDGGTERRSSYTGTYATTDFGTGSYVTESVTDSAVDEGRMSFAASSTVGTVGFGEPSVLGDEENDDGDEDDEDDGQSEGGEGSRHDGADSGNDNHGQLQLYTGGGAGLEHEGDDSKALVLHPSDSGLGTEPPTAALDNREVDFFRGGGQVDLQAQ